MNNFLLGFCLSLQFFSRIPLNFACYSEQRQSRVLNYLPLVGGLFALILVGLLSVFSYIDFWLAGILASEHFFTSQEAALLLLVVWVWLSGALHLDGVADSADAALGSLNNPQKALTIMHDSRIGTSAAVVLVLLLLAKWVLLNNAIALYWSVSSTSSSVSANASFLLLAVAIGMSVIMARLAPLFLVKISRSATVNPKHQAMFAQVSWKVIGFYSLIISLLLFFLMPSALFLWLPLLLGILAVKVFAGKLLGGINGDLLGVAIEFSELLLLWVALWLLRFALL